MTWTIWMAGFIVLLTIAALLKRIETRLVLFVAGLVMALFALSPQTALGAFVANMTNSSRPFAHRWALPPSSPSRVATCTSSA